MDDIKYIFVANSYTALLEDLKIDANEARSFMGHFLCGVETVKRFVNIHFHRNVSILKCWRCPTPRKISADAHGYFHPFGKV